jgi:hypothetical protein
VDWVNGNAQMGVGQPPAQLSNAQILLDPP